ncbi:MAG: methyl-accepting chemotaxis protein [Rhodothermales bacterium]|nr:methyl-accepting chemotaxis protein [Rhodothermales bacterium]
MTTFFRNLSISRKLLVGFGVLATIAGLSNLLAFGVLILVQDAARMTIQKEVPHQTALLEIQKLTTEGHLWFEEIMSGDEGEDVNQVFALWQEASVLSSALLASGKVDGQVYLPIENVYAITSVEELHEHLTELIAVGRERYEGFKNDTTAAGSNLDEQFDAVYEEVIRQSDVALEAIRVDLHLSAASIERTYTTGWMSMLAFLIASFAMAWVSLRNISRLIVAPITRLNEVVAAVQQGDLNQKVQVDSKDETGFLGSGINHMVEGIREARQSMQDEKQAADRERLKADDQRAYLAHHFDLMLKAMNRFAQGDLTVHLTAEKYDSVGQLFDGFNQAVGNLRQRIEHVNKAIDHTTTTVEQIRASTSDLAAGVRLQSEQSHEVALAVEEMVQTIVENSQNASHTAELTERNGKEAREGGEVVQATVDMIRRLAHIVADSVGTVEHLGASSQKIGEIVKTIDQIANQTNMLALNAAIEAARAGEQGRGFAVVADEVRRLAERTTSATTEIAQMIRTIQSETLRAVGTMRLGNEEVERGMVLADKAGVALDKIVGGTSRTVEMVTQIAAASEEQSTTSEQIASNVDMISRATSNASAGITQIAQSTEDLKTLTEELRSLVAYFKLGHDHQTFARA